MLGGFYPTAQRSSFPGVEIILYSREEPVGAKR